MTRYIDPYTDFGFKKLFGEEASKDILIDFLNQLLPHKHQIAKLDFVDKEQLPDNIDERKAFFDIACISKTGERFIVEMQKGKINNFKDRTLYYLTYPISKQAVKGEWDYYLNTVYFIGVLDFYYENPDNAEFQRNVYLKDQFNEVFFDKLGIIYLQMPAFNKTEDQLETKMDKWAYFLKNLECFNNIPPILNEPIFKHAFEIAEFVKLPINEQIQYDKSKLDYHSWRLVKETAFKDGERKGIEKGKIEGKKERDLEIAISMKCKDLPISMIMEITGLTEQEIREL